MGTIFKRFVADKAFSVKGKFVASNGAPSLARSHGVLANQGTAKDDKSIEEQYGKGVTGGVAGLAVSKDEAEVAVLLTKLRDGLKRIVPAVKPVTVTGIRGADAAAIRNEAFHAGRLAYEATQAVNFAHGDEMRAYLNPQH